MIKSIKSNFIETVLDVLPDSFYVRLKKKHPIVSFLYHTVSNEELPHIKNLYRYKNEREFENDY